MSRMLNRIELSSGDFDFHPEIQWILLREQVFNIIYGVCAYFVADPSI